MMKIDNCVEMFSKINFADMDNISISKWLRANMKDLSIKNSFIISKLLKESYRMGEIRGEILK